LRIAENLNASVSGQIVTAQSLDIWKLQLEAAATPSRAQWIKWRVPISRGSKVALIAAFASGFFLLRFQESGKDVAIFDSFDVDLSTLDVRFFARRECINNSWTVTLAFQSEREEPTNLCDPQPVSQSLEVDANCAMCPWSVPADNSREVLTEYAGEELTVLAHDIGDKKVSLDIGVPLTMDPNRVDARLKKLRATSTRIEIMYDSDVLLHYDVDVGLRPGKSDASKRLTSNRLHITTFLFYRTETAQQIKDMHSREIEKKSAEIACLQTSLMTAKKNLATLQRDMEGFSLQRVQLEAKNNETEKTNETLRAALEKKEEQLSCKTREGERAVDNQYERLSETLMCPITQERFVDPVIASDGHTYERAAIQAWIRKNRTSPLTRERLTNELRPNFTVKSLLAL
jgi:hypothetical protein